MGFFRYVSSKQKTITHFGCDLKTKFKRDLSTRLTSLVTFFNLNSIPFDLSEIFPLRSRGKSGLVHFQSCLR
jgi:hypothetical protein